MDYTVPEGVTIIGYSGKSNGKNAWEIVDTVVDSEQKGKAYYISSLPAGELISEYRDSLEDALATVVGDDNVSKIIGEYDAAGNRLERGSCGFGESLPSIDDFVSSKLMGETVGASNNLIVFIPEGVDHTKVFATTELEYIFKNDTFQYINGIPKSELESIYRSGDVGKQSVYDIISKTSSEVVGTTSDIDAQAELLKKSFSENGKLNSNNSEFSISKCYDADGKLIGIELESSRSGVLIDRPDGTATTERVVKADIESTTDDVNSGADNNEDVDDTNEGEDTKDSTDNSNENGNEGTDDNSDTTDNKESSSDSETSKDSDETSSDSEGDKDSSDSSDGDEVKNKEDVDTNDTDASDSTNGNDTNNKTDTGSNVDNSNTSNKKNADTVAVLPSGEDTSDSKVPDTNQSDTGTNKTPDTTNGSSTSSDSETSNSSTKGKTNKDELTDNAKKIIEECENHTNEIEVIMFDEIKINTVYWSLESIRIPIELKQCEEEIIDDLREAMKVYESDGTQFANGKSWWSIEVETVICF